MPEQFDVITFDCYGTLIDWESGISDAFMAASAADGVPLDREAILREYARIEPAVESEPYRSYREVLRISAVRVAASLGWKLDPAIAGFLAESLPSWRPFADTNPALGRLLDAGIRLAILSNTDDDLISASRRHLDVDFDFIVTAEQVRSYKPGTAHFLAARERIGEARWLHAGASIFHDVVPANALGITTAWVNRRNEPVPERGSERPAILGSDLGQLAGSIL
jgi:2-haloalkanoic acid dehalogenase type II